jgi:hypothetical protein
MKNKAPLYYEVKADEYPDDPKNGTFQHARIRVFFLRDYEIEKGELPHWTSDNHVTFTYQRHYEDNTMSHWYAEKIDHVPSCDSDDMMNVVNLLKKMENYRKKMNEKGFYMNDPDHLRTRIKLLANIGAEHLEMSFKTHTYYPAPCPVSC